ncbi:MAG TPA: tetratricopeptide repeat protein [Syntrophales bacterium]|nr:tetratricopeptide repeat protein [Syntrophales bacterium]HOL60197.1 tetratricopeptide repeat protein [Syntrophales bacterium]HPO36323.1 tetratricopeptide repeat protein [Syntrophales bacterium]
MTVIKREDVGAIVKALNESNFLLTRKNLYSSIVKFREALEKILHTPMLPADERDIKNMVNEFQYRLASSRVFYECYGPVSFRDNDLETTLDFLKQLIQVKEDEIKEEMERAKKAQESQGERETFPQAEAVRILIEKGDYELARELIGDNEDLLSYIVDYYNERGIAARREGKYDQAISEFRKVVSICPDDEGLFYNLARAYIEKKEWQAARETMEEALELNPDFKEGKKLLSFIEDSMK